MSVHEIEIPIDQLTDFCRRHCVQRLALFGSILRDDFGPEGDVDVLVGFLPGAKTGLRFFTMQNELSELFGRSVDLNTPAFLSDYFRDKVLDEARTVYDAA